MACCVTGLGRVCIKLTSLVLSSGESICSPTAGEMFSYRVISSTRIEYGLHQPEQRRHSHCNTTVAAPSATRKAHTSTSELESGHR